MSLRITVWAVVVLILFALGAFGFAVVVRKGAVSLEGGVVREDCDIQEVRRVVRGDSLKGIVEDGTEVTILFGYYECYPVSRDDVVAYRYAGREEPIIKLVKGVPGDSFTLVSADGKTGIDDSWYMALNGEPLVNFKGELYLFGGKGYRMLRLYEESYEGAIPMDAYLILGSGPWGSLDSSEFGLVDVSDIVGKVVVGRR